MRGIAGGRADEHEVRGGTFFKQCLDIGRDLFIGRVVIRGFEIGALVLQYLQQFVLQHFVHFTDFIDEQDAAMGLGHEAGFRLRDAAVGEIPAGTLIDRVMYGAQQRVGHVARVPAQCGTICFDKRCCSGKGRGGFRLGGLEHEAGGCRLADTRRAIEQQVLRIRGAELGHERFDRARLADDLFEGGRAQQLHDGLGQADLFQRLELLAFFLFLRGLGGGLFLLEHLHADVLHVVLMVFFEFFRNLFLDFVLDGAAGHEIGHLSREGMQDLGDVLLGRDFLDGRIFQDDAL